MPGLAKRQLDKGDLERLERRGNEARGLLEHGLIREALSGLYETVHRSWENTQPEESERREELWRNLQAARAFEQYLTRVATTGIQAQKAAAEWVDGRQGHSTAE